MGLLKGDTSHIGLDIGTTGIRLVQLKGGKGLPSLVTYSGVPVDPKVIESDAKGDQQKVAEIIKELFHTSHATTKNTVLGLPSSKVFASLVSLPKMSNQELAKSIQYQAEQYIPMPLDEVKLDWLVVGESAESNQQEVLLVAAPKSLTEAYLDILDHAGLDLVAIEPDAFGLVRSLVPNLSIAVAVLDIGAKSTDLVIMSSGTPRLIRSVAVGGQTLIKAAAHNLSVDEDQASQFLFKFGLTQSKLEGQVFKAIKSGIDMLTSELDKSNKFFTSKYRDIKIEKIVLTGGSSSLPELPTYLANATGLPVEIGNSWSRIKFNVSMQDQLMSISNQFAVANGLALRGLV
jgi:type IV pilus assembly protein PilM